MKTTKKQSIAMEMTQEEAEWLKELVRNPINGITVHEEEMEDRAMRRKFYEAIEGALI